jgi:hypothetical protein
LSTCNVAVSEGTTRALRFILEHLNDRAKWSSAENTALSYLIERAPIAEGAELGCTTVEAGGVAYHVHGVALGGPQADMPSPRAKRFIQNRVRQCAGPHGLNVLCDERFSRYWDLGQNTAIDDIGNTLSVSDRSGQVFDEWKSLKESITSESSESRYRISRVVKRATEQALRDENWTGIARSLHQDLPYPLILDDEPVDIAEFYTDLMRSKYMAEYMVSYAALTGLSSLHALVGLGREREVARFITNPGTTPTECILSLSSE